MKSSLAFLFGILFVLQIGVLRSLEADALWYLVLLGFLLLFIWLLKWKKQQILPFIIGAFVGCIRIFFWSPEAPEDLQTYFDEQVYVEGNIISFPESKGETVVFDLATESIQKESIETNIRVTLRIPQDLFRGDKVALSGKLEEPLEDGDFSYKQYLSLKKVHSTMNVTEVEVLNQSLKGIGSLLNRLRVKIQHHISLRYTSETGGFLEGLLLGRKYGLSEELSLAFKRTGLSHIIAISGYNITLVITIMGSLFGFLGRYLKISVSIIAVILFTIFVGAEASVVRACLMGLISLMALSFGRQSFVWSTLLWAVVIMNFWEPRTLLFDVGFQLSVAATAGVVGWSKKMVEFFSFLPNLLGIRESFALTIAAQITTIPVLLYHFQAISLTSPIANVVIAPFIPYAMMFGFFELLVSFIPVISHILSFVTSALLNLVIWISQFFSKLPFGYIEGIRMGIWGVVGYYAILFKFMAKKLKQ